MHKEFITLRAFSSAGSEHLPYKQRVGGSNPSTPTSNITLHFQHKKGVYTVGSENSNTLKELASVKKKFLKKL